MNAYSQPLPARRNRVVVAVVIGAAVPARLRAAAPLCGTRLTRNLRRRHACSNRHHQHKEVRYGQPTAPAR